MAYTTINKGSSYFNGLAYTGTNTSTAYNNGLDMSTNGGWVWLKVRNSTGDHGLFDSVRGTTKRLRSNTTDAEDTLSGLTSFNSTGFTLGTAYNDTPYTFMSWSWIAGGAGVSNTAGSITSTVSANTTAGFSIVSYTNPASGSPFTVGHGLGVAPKMIIVKTRNVAQTWGVWHTSIGFGNYLRLDSTAATAAANLVTATSSTTFSTYQNHHATSDTLIAYCFAEIKGYSKFGSYIGNGDANGRFIYTGFKPAFVMIKTTASGDGWFIFDNKRTTYNVMSTFLLANSSAADETNINRNIDFLSNGFKLRNSDTSLNFSGYTYIYMAFAENPFVTSGGIPVTAR